MTDPADIGAVVVSYRSAATLPPCLTSLAETGIEAVAVVDNAPDAASERIAHTAGATYLPQPVNRGFATAANIGARRLENDWLLFLNPDAALEPGAIAAVVSQLVQPRLGALGLQLLNDTGQPENFAFGKDVTLGSLVLRKATPQPVNHPTQLVDWVSGAAMLVRRRAFAAASGFDERFFLYWEDVDLCKRLRAAGWDVLHVPHARVRHHRGASLANPDVRTRLYDAAADRYFQKHYATPIWLLQRWLRRLYRLFSPQAF